MTEYKTKTQIVYEKIKELIVTGEYQPGERIVITRISKLLKVSDIPVREAIRLLESKGYVTLIPNSGPIVSEISTKDLVQRAEVRRVLEAYATRLSAEKLSDEEINELKKILVDMEKSIENGNLSEYSHLNHKFHTAIYEANENAVLTEQIAQFWEQTERNKAVFKLIPKRAIESLEEHKTMVKLIETKELDKLEFFVRNHKLRSHSDLNAYLQAETSH